MRKTVESEKGYALLVVLFLIVFIFTVSAVFFRGSLSNAKQEQKVDQNHLAVVAAEMGVDYYVGKVNNEERKIQKEVLNGIQADLTKLNDCGGRPNTTKPGCNIKSIETILIEAEDDYLNKVSALVNSIKISEPTNIKLSKVGSSPYSFQIDKNEVSGQENGGKVIIKLGIIGNSKAEKPKLLKTVLSYEVPKFVIRKTGNNNQPNAKPVDIYKFFKDRSDFIKNVGCSEKNGHCSSGKFYSDGNISANNPNNQGGLIWVHNGYLDANNMNQFNFTLIVNSLNGKNMNQMKGKLILLGDEDNKGKITDKISVGFQSSGKICVNVDGFSKGDIEKISFDKPAQIYFYSSSKNPVWPSNANNSPKRSGSLVDFVNECMGQPLIESGSSDVVRYEVFESAIDLLVDVNY
ncbi:hypothetical protein AB1K89_11595 [Sporosarcina sp. 179-K 8C2 HS]|uniref:hypothetical protein n=1 Tax=Sporosarcina sp. 179-K 8C2 HS TaxID=3142387 RepID=UPI0039A2BB59